VTPATPAGPRTHLLTGAGSGIGAALAERLHARGDALVLAARSTERADELADRFPGASTFVADLADPASLRLPELERLDSLHHVAGVVDLATVAEQDDARLREQVDVNLVAPAVLTRLALPALRRAGGLVVFVGSTAGLTANPSWSAYAATKFGLRGFADALRGEEAAAGHGVRVTSVFPGRTATPMQAKVHQQEGKDYDPARFVDPGTVADTVLHVLDLPRDATISEVVVRPGPGG
jgi:NADP-dependent 3-hydroxy acid dehydrogenase YdfG